MHGCACNPSLRWFSPCSRTQRAPFEPAPFLGSTKDARLVEERRVAPLEKYGEELS